MKGISARLRAIVAAIESEAGRNAEFAAQLERALGMAGGENVAATARGGRRTQRRNKGAFNPMDVLRKSGEDGLRQRLAALAVEQLKDIVAENGMDQRKLAMKWKNADRLTDLIVETAQARIVRGDVFR
jgi:hypothetical protein